MKRGSICWVNLEPAQPPEFGKVRPALVVSNSVQNSALPTVVVVPISTRPPEIWPLRIPCSVLGKKSFLVLPGLRQVNKMRIQSTVGQAPPAVLSAVDLALRAYLG